MIMHRWMILTPSPMVAIVALQVQLRAVGYDPGPIDGRGGRRTMGALTAYAKNRRIVLNQATVGMVLARLRAEAYVMLLEGEATEEPRASEPQGDLPVIPIGRW
jgi:hypothetical protein